MSHFRLEILIRAALSLFVLFACFLGEGWALMNVIPADSQMVTGRILGTLDSALMVVITYWLGSSSDSSTKDKIDTTKAENLSIRTNGV